MVLPLANLLPRVGSFPPSLRWYHANQIIAAPNCLPMKVEIPGVYPTTCLRSLALRNNIDTVVIIVCV